jgi:hydroxymethylbilane synthase
VSRALAGSCQLPLAAYGQLTVSGLNLRGLVASPDGTQIVRAEVRGNAAEPEALGDALAAELRRRGAGEILAKL